MTTHFSDTIQLLQYAKEKVLFIKLVRQLQKDFVLANISVDIKEDIGITELKDLLHEKIYFLLMERFPEYLNLLYIVDVPENLFKELIVTDAVEISEQVSFLILKREFQKVRLKEKYSS